MADNKILSDLNEKLVSLDKIISLQSAEISKSKSSIFTLKKCLSEQANVLNLFIKERDRLQEQRSLRSKLSNVEERNCKEIYESVMKMGAQSNKKRKINIDPFKLFRSENEGNANPKSSNPYIKSEVDMKEFHTSGNQSTPRKCRREMEEDLKIQSEERSVPSNPEGVISVPEVKNRTVLKLVVFGNDICVAGSGGLLLRCRHPNTQVFDTGTDDDVFHIEIVKSKNVFCLVAFTKRKILIYDGKGNHRDIHLPGIISIFCDIDMMYVSLESGVIKKICTDDFAMVDYVFHQHGLVRCFLPGKGKNHLALISLQDSLLYVTEKRDFVRLRQVPGVENVQRIIRIQYNNCLCHSNDRIWFFNSEFELTKTIHMTESIRFVDVTYTLAAVLDEQNMLHMYNILDCGYFSEEKSASKMQGTLSAMCLAKKNVYIADGCDIVVFESII